ncbi:NirD/YgiW/YdeI family stress tolerance protein [Stenotrophobium rhamnosiphilum]|uniref:Uncharacterized protein n=1 Tax=Stenotrophobium rhamnosiphilum TaxID=2029166 RepID=A0A2T5MK91_9GAMM|nr:NirD/YgiW/YdeI family stress tolerance protein [Stenotrophobium rhamnosiphilum]PTU32996.1 hypothetical protein CJD38_02460 [Stenotrophobium rhamnosiphilum]
MNRISPTLAASMLVTGLTTFASAATAQYIGPSSSATYKSIDEVTKNPVEDMPVVLEGYLIRKVGKEKYIFSDGKKEIRVEIDQKHFPATAISEKTRVQIRGEVEKDFMESPEIDVDQLVVMN